MKNCSLALSCFVITSTALFPTCAQTVGSAPGSGLSVGPSEAVIARLFSGQSPFKAHLQVQMQSTRMNMAGEGDFAYLEGKTWNQMNRATMFMVLPGGSTNRMQMDKAALGSMFSIYRPDKQAGFQIVPPLRAYVETSYAQTDKGSGALEITRTESGKATIDGHPCLEYAVVAIEKNGKKHELTQWCATDLKDFPIRIETTVGGSAYQFSFVDIQFVPPEANLFEVPPDFTKYADMRELMLSHGDAFGSAAPRKKR
jgi:hypothetical protein